MTSVEYQRICDRLAREAVRYAAERVGDEAVASDSEHWIDVFLDERLPAIDPEALIAVTAHADAYEKNAGYPAPSPAIAAFHAFQADVWDAIHRMEATATLGEEETVARGMLSRYRTVAIALEMAHWHAMDHAAKTEGRARWLRVRSLIERLSKEDRP